jgi:hypothetical protein
MIFVATLPLNSFAQENLKRAIDDFTKSPKSASYAKAICGLERGKSSSG